MNAGVARRRVAAILTFVSIAAVAVLESARTIDARTSALHASLRSSEPRDGAVLHAPPQRIRLVFSEPIEPTMSALTWAAAPPSAPPLASSVDPRDRHALVASSGQLPPGAYVVAWRVVSTDGHRADGRIGFRILAAAGDSTPLQLSVQPTTAAPPPTDSSAVVPEHEQDTRAERSVRILRACAVTALLALAGLCMMIAILPPSGPRPISLATVLAVLATILLASYTVAWSLGVAGAPGVAPVDAVMTATSTTPGALEVARVALALLALWAIGLARRPGLAALFAVTATLITGASGHSAVTLPYWSIPLKAIHLLAVAVWFGGLLWIVTAERHGDRYLQGTRRISSLALISVVLVLATGIAQSAFFLPSVRALYESGYGRVLLLKLAGLLVLMLFGAFHRRAVPRMDTTMARRRFRRSVRAEIAVMLIVSALGGLLATIALPKR